MSPHAPNDRKDRPARTEAVSDRSAERVVWERQLLVRLQWVAGHLTFREIGNLTGANPESVRRYMTRGRPPTFFVASISRALKTPLEWLMFGVGIRSSADDRVRAAQHDLVSEVKGVPNAEGNVPKVRPRRREAGPPSTPPFSRSR